MDLGITHTNIQSIAFAFKVFAMIRDFILMLVLLSVCIFYSLVMHEVGRLAGFTEATAIYEAMLQKP